MTFLIISVIVFNAVSFLVHKRLVKSELLAIFLFSIVLGFLTDIIFDLKYNLYGYFFSGVQYSGFIPIFGLFPPAGILYMNFFPFKRSILQKVVYIFAWIIFCLFFEFLSIKSGYFYHNGWTYLYSALFYPFLFLIHHLHLKIVRMYLAG